MTKAPTARWGPSSLTAAALPISSSPGDFGAWVTSEERLRVSLGGHAPSRVDRPAPEEDQMTLTDAPVDLYIAAYPDPQAAQEDWDAIKQLASDDVIKVDGLILVSRDADGKITVKDDFHTARKGAKWGAIGGAVVGLVFPPAILAGALVGAGAGLGIGGLKAHGQKKEIKADVEDALPPNSSGIVALFDEVWAVEGDKVITNASSVTKDQVDEKSAKAVKEA